MIKKIALAVAAVALASSLMACAAPSPSAPTAEVVAELAAQPEDPQNTPVQNATPAPTAEPEVSPGPQPAQTPAMKPAGPDNWSQEPIGGLYVGQSEQEAAALLGEAERKDEASVWGVDGRVYQSWFYPKKGVELIMVWEPDQPETSEVYLFTATAPYEGRTPRGIGIGSAKEDVISAYKEGIDPQENNREDEVIVGSIYGGILIEFKDGKVSAFSCGAFAE